MRLTNPLIFPAPRVAAGRQGRYGLGSGCHPVAVIKGGILFALTGYGTPGLELWLQRLQSSWCRPFCALTSTRFCCMRCSV